MYWLVLPFTLIIFIGLDFLINKKTSESPKYYPNLKIWGIGFILGLAVFIFSYFEPLKDILLNKKHILLDKSEITIAKDIKVLDIQVSQLEIIQQVAIMLFFLAVLGIILAALVKIVRDDW